MSEQNVDLVLGGAFPHEGHLHGPLVWFSELVGGHPRQHEVLGPKVDRSFPNRPRAACYASPD